MQKQVLKVLRRLRFTHLLPDGTSWRRGEQKYHYMVLSVLAGPVAIRPGAVPIYWKQLGKIGASSQSEREELLTGALQHFNLEGMTLLADREYIGKQWFSALVAHRINFIIRLRTGNYRHAVDATPGRAYWQLYEKCLSWRKFVRKRFMLDGKPYYLSMKPDPANAGGEGAIVFLTLLRPAGKTVDQYLKRWRTECLFRHLKTNGFHLEDLNMSCPLKSNLMMAVVCLAYVISIRAGWKDREAIRQIQFDDETVLPAQSVFRHGLSKVFYWCGSFQRFISFLHQLFETKKHRIVKNVQ